MREFLGIDEVLSIWAFYLPSGCRFLWLWAPVHGSKTCHCVAVPLIRAGSHEVCMFSMLEDLSPIIQPLLF